MTPRENNSMADDPCPPCNVFAITIGQFANTNSICVISGQGRTTHLHWMAAPAARLFAADLIKFADNIDPPQKEWRVTGEDNGQNMVAAFMANKEAGFVSASKMMPIVPAELPKNWERALRKRGQEPRPTKRKIKKPRKRK